MSQPVPTDERPAVASPRVALSHRVSPAALLTLVLMTLERLSRGRRLLLLCLLYLLPTGIALLSRLYVHSNSVNSLSDAAEETLVFYMIPQALVPLTALVLAAGMIQNEVEDQTFTYLLIRPIPRWLIYVAKLVGTTLLAAVVTALFTSLAMSAIHSGEPDYASHILLDRAPRVAALYALAIMVYTSLFGCLALFVKKTMVLGVAYILLFEGAFANFDFVARRATVMFYERVIAERWLGVHVPAWSINLDEAPSGLECLLTLLGAVLVSTVIAGIIMSLREFRLKTPEGS